MVCALLSIGTTIGIIAVLAVETAARAGARGARMSGWAGTAFALVAEERVAERKRLADELFTLTSTAAPAKELRIYGLTERQFRNIFERVAHEPGVTGENLLIELELRLDNVVHRMGFAASRQAARQLARHRHVQVNGRTVDIPSYRLRPGDEVRVAPGSRELASVQASLAALSRAAPVSWIAVDTEKATGKITERPTRDAIPTPAQEQLIVELYSK